MGNDANGVSGKPTVLVVDDDPLVRDMIADTRYIHKPPRLRDLIATVVEAINSHS
jgi:hypothetical protein